MEYTIQELRAYHKLAQPEMKKALEKANNTLLTGTMDRNVRHVLSGLTMACRSQNEVIDTLFAEIDRLNGMKEKI